MCGRYYLEIEESEIREIIAEIEKRGANEHPEMAVKTGEIFPTNLAPIIAMYEDGIRPGAMMWGFPRWNAPGVVFNARQETALSKNMFRKSLLERRVAVPTSGFFEWKSVPGQKKKDKYLFREPGSSILYLAGFYNIFSDKDGPIAERFTILTTAPNDSMEPYHNRMPVLIERSEIKDWIMDNDFQKYLERVPGKLEAIKVL